MRKIGILTLLLPAMLIMNCSGTGPTAPGSKQVVVSSLLKDLGLGSNITGVGLVVIAEGMDPITAVTDVVDGVATLEVEVPLGEDRLFEMTAFNASDVPLYRGSTTADVLGGVPTEVEILMLPLVPMVRISELFSDTDMGSDQTIRVFVHNVDSVFGVSLRVEYDSAIVEVVDVSEGNLFSGRDGIFFTQQRPGYVAVAYSLKGTQSPQGVNDDGTIIAVTFRPRMAGTTALTIPASTMSLIDWQSNTLPREGQLYIESGELRVNAP